MKKVVFALVWLAGAGRARRLHASLEQSEPRHVPSGSNPTAGFDVVRRAFNPSVAFNPSGKPAALYAQPAREPELMLHGAWQPAHRARHLMEDDDPLDDITQRIALENSGPNTDMRQRKDWVDKMLGNEYKKDPKRKGPELYEWKESPNADGVSLNFDADVLGDVNKAVGWNAMSDFDKKLAAYKIPEAQREEWIAAQEQAAAQGITQLVPLPGKQEAQEREATERITITTPVSKRLPEFVREEEEVTTDIGKYFRYDGFQRACVVAITLLLSLGFGKTSAQVLDPSVAEYAQLGGLSLVVGYVIIALFGTVQAARAPDEKDENAFLWFFKLLLTGPGGYKELSRRLEDNEVSMSTG